MGALKDGCKTCVHGGLTKCRDGQYHKLCVPKGCPHWDDIKFECTLKVGDLCLHYESKEKIDVSTNASPNQFIAVPVLEERQALAEELSKYDAAGGDKNDQGKAPFHLMPPRALFDVAEAYADGIKKYKAHNWLRGLKWSRYFAAAMRHMWAWWMGEDYAPDSGVHHLAHAAACILNLLEYQHGYQRFDDRPNACLKQLLNEAKGAEA